MDDTEVKFQKLESRVMGFNLFTNGLTKILWPMNQHTKTREIRQILEGVEVSHH